MAPPPPPSSGKSLLTSFDDLIRCNKVLLEASEDPFLQFVLNQEQCRRRWQAAEIECQRLQIELGKSEQEVRGLELKLGQARELLNVEMSHRKRTEQERDVLASKWSVVRDMILTDTGANNDETRQKLKLLEESLPDMRRRTNTNLFSPGRPHMNLSAVNEINSTGSILDASDLSFDMTCDQTGGAADESKLRSGRIYKNRKSSGIGAAGRKKSRSIGNRLSGGERQKEQDSAKPLEGVASKRKSSGRKSSRKHNYSERNIDDYVPSAPPPEDVLAANNAAHCWLDAQAMTQMTPHKAMNHQESTKTLTPQESYRPLDHSPSATPYTPGVKRTFSNAGIKSRKHTFISKTVIKPESCGPCGKRIKFGKACLKCRDCKATTHLECKDEVPLPCADSACRTPTRNQGATIADFTPLHAPMVPALIIHCVNEVEARGLSEVGLYRVPGSEKEVKDLKEKFMKGKGCPTLRKYDIHVICGCIKDFLRSLREPLIPPSMWQVFVDAAGNPDSTDGESALYQAISELPQPNRDTLAFIILHLQKVSSCRETKMPLSNLAKILGPTVLGYSSAEPCPANILAETGMQAVTMEKLINIDSDYWETYLGDNDAFFTPSRNILSPNLGLTPEAPSQIFRPLSQNTGLTPTTSHGGWSEARNRANTIAADQRNKKNIFASPMLI